MRCACAYAMRGVMNVNMRFSLSITIGGRQLMTSSLMQTLRFVFKGCRALYNFAASIVRHMQLLNAPLHLATMTLRFCRMFYACYAGTCDLNGWFRQRKTLAKLRFFRPKVCVCVCCQDYDAHEVSALDSFDPVCSH